MELAEWCIIDGISHCTPGSFANCDKMVSILCCLLSQVRNMMNINQEVVKIDSK